MIRRITLVWTKFKAFAGLAINIRDLSEFLLKVWSLNEWVLIGVVLLWVPLLRLASVLFVHFGIKLSFRVKRKYCKITLRVIFWLTVFATLANLMAKWQHGEETEKIIALAAVYLFVLIMDYIETEELVHYIENHDA